MKIVTIVGARPQFIKAAAVSRVIRTEINEVLIHTGQHYDNNMSEIFFQELNIPEPNYNLNVGSESHARQTGHMMIGIEDILIKEKPDAVMIYGDTNSTLAGALAAVKLHIPIIHVEAGLRSFNLKMPEEQNRILTDRISTILFCPTVIACNNLKAEGITKNVHDVGDVMCDAVLHYEKHMEKKSKEYFFNNLLDLDDNVVPVTDHWYLATIHRAENTGEIVKIKNILEALDKLDKPVIFPVHPRIRRTILELNELNQYNNIRFVQPIGYIEMLYFTKHATKIITDSGGLQKESYILRTPCITVRPQTEWVETLDGNLNVLTEPDTNEIIDKVFHTQNDFNKYKPHYGNGDSAKKILQIIRNTI